MTPRQRLRFLQEIEQVLVTSTLQSDGSLIIAKESVMDAVLDEFYTALIESNGKRPHADTDFETTVSAEPNVAWNHVAVAVMNYVMNLDGDPI